MKKTILLTLLMISLSVFARSGGGSTVGNGGDYVASQFLLQSFSVIEILKNNPQINLPIDVEVLQKKIVNKELMVVAVDEMLFDKVGKPVDALNFPNGKSRVAPPILEIEDENMPLIILNKDSWVAYFKSNSFLLPLITHELLGVMGVDDDNFVHAKKILKYGACQEDDSGKLKCSNYYPLIEAVKLGDLGRVKFLIENGIELNAEDSIGFTAADYAFKNRDIELLVYLHHADAQVSAHLNRGYQKSLIVFALNFLNYYCDEKKLQMESSNECSFVKTLLEILLQEKTSTEVLNNAIYASVGDVTLDYIIPLVDAGAEISTLSVWRVDGEKRPVLEWSLLHDLLKLGCMYPQDDRKSCVDEVVEISRYVLKKRSFNFNWSTSGSMRRTIMSSINPLYHAPLIQLFLEYGANPNEIIGTLQTDVMSSTNMNMSLFAVSTYLGASDTIRILSSSPTFKLEQSPSPLIEIVHGIRNHQKSEISASAYETMKLVLQIYKNQNRSINLKDSSGLTPLDHAYRRLENEMLTKETKNELESLVKLLKENGACRTKGFFNRCVD